MQKNRGKENTMGRPRIEIKAEEFEKMCEIQCTLTEIATVLGCSEDTIERWCKRTYEKTFAEAYKKFSDGGKMSLRRMQFRAAEQGSVSMMIWLGKQWLGQSDKQEVAVGQKDDATIKEMEQYFADKRTSPADAKE